MDVLRQLPPSATVDVSRRNLLRGAGGLALLAGLAGTLTACSSSTAADTLNVFNYGDANEAKIFNQVLGDFAKSRGLTVSDSVVPVPSWADYISKLSIEMAGGNSPDVINLALEGNKLAVNRGLLEPLGPYMANSALGKKVASMPRVLVNAFTSKGNLYQVPEGWQTMAIFYNPKIFQAAGLAEPAEDWTWDDFLATAVKLTSGQVMGFGMPWGFFQLHPWWLSNNASAVTPDGTQPSLSSPAFVESVQFLTDLVLKYKVTPDPTTTVDVYSEFSAGRFAMIATGRYSLLGWEQAGFNDYKAVKWPKKVSHRTVIGGGGWAISAKAGDKTLAWEAIEALMTEQTVHGLAELGEQVPIYPEADVDPANGAQRAAQRYIDTLLPDCVPVAAPTFYDELQTVAMSQLQAIVTGQASPAAGLAAADQEIKANL